MFARCARIAPARIRTLSSPWYFTASVLSECSTDTPPPSASVNAPLAPLMVTLSGARLTPTPAGNSTIRLATLDISVLPVSARLLASGNDAQDFAALADRLRRLVRHHALGRRYDHRAHAAEHARNLVLAAVDAQARPAHALDPVDHRAAVVVLQADRQHRLAVVLVQAEVRDIALVLQHLEDRSFQLRRGDHDVGLARRLAV